MRVLMVSSNWSSATGGGAEAYVRDLTAALRARQCTVAAVTLGVDGPDVVAAVPPRPHRLDAHSSASAWRKLRFHRNDIWRRDVGRSLRSAVGAFRPDVVHSHVVAGMSVAALTMPARLNVPHVHTLHDHWLRCWRSTATTAQQQPCGPACAAIERARAAALHRSAPHVFIGISQAVLDSHRHLPATASAHAVILHPAAPAPAATRRSPHAGPVFGFLGQLNPNKGVGVFLEAARRTAATGMRFVVAGRGRLDEVVATADVENLEYRGWISGAEKDRFFADIDCLVVPSLWAEPAGLVVREAAAHGVPVIASETGGLPEYIPSSCRRLLFPPGDVGALVVKLQMFAATPAAFAVDPGEAGTWDDHVEQILAAYTTARGKVAVAA